MKIAMAQINATVGDIEGNLVKISEKIELAKKSRCALVAFPELCLTGYPPQDLLYERTFVERNKEALQKLVEKNSDIVAVVGFVDYDEVNLYNAAAIIEGNKLIRTVYKTLLPTYDVFDEDRYFEPQRQEALRPVVVKLDTKVVKLGVEICEDLWDQGYEVKVTDILVQRGAELIINISASPFHSGKSLEREELLKAQAQKNHVPIFYVNLVGGQDELVFDGHSLAVDAFGNVIALGRQFEEDFVVTEIDPESRGTGSISRLPCSREEEMFNALILGVRDYFRKTNFRKAVIGLSGGIDSSLTACIASEALGRENVIGVSMPSRFSSNHGKTDAQRLAETLGIVFVQFSIQNIVDSYRKNLKEPLEEIRNRFSTSRERDDPVADENIQPRARGNCLMDISNRLRDLRIMVLNTGNKTELALGYCTLYGDMTGGIGLLGDVSKLDVYRLARYVNEKEGKEIIPENVFRKRPSPELKDDQVDPFDFTVVSPLVDEIVENRRSKQELIDMGYPVEVVEDIYRRIQRAEYKRWQAPPCIKITPKAFGIGWKMPIVNKYSG